MWFSGEANWTNLKLWIRANWESNTIVDLSRAAHTDLENMRVAVAAHELMAAHRGSSWEQLETSLESLRFAVGGYTTAWQ